VKIEDVKRGKKFQRTNIVAAQFKSNEGETKVIVNFAPFYTRNSD
jgi:hypothetical protein